MFHHEILSEIKKEFSSRNDFLILDLGYGDSYMVKHALKEHQNVKYLGIDTSNNTLEFSKKNLNAETESFFIINMQENKVKNIKKVFTDTEKLFSMYSSKR